MTISAAILLATTSGSMLAASPGEGRGRAEYPAGARGKILIVVSAADEIELSDGSRRAMGFWADEFARPYSALRKAGIEVDVATPGGRIPVPDEASLPAGFSAKAYLDRFPVLRTPLDLEKVDRERASSYAAVVIPGGYAPMVDLAGSRAIARVLDAAVDGGALVAAICHGQAALLPRGDPDEPWRWKGYRMAAFTNEEERRYLGGRTPRGPLEDRLKKAGARWASGEPGESVVVRDRNLLTGQNAASCPAFTAALIEALASPKAAAPR